MKAYPPDTPEELTRDDLAAQMRRFGEAFDLNVIHGTKVKATSFDGSNKTWTVNLTTQAAVKTVHCKHLALATGIGSWVPHIPAIPNGDAYSGTVMHSHHYKNAERLATQGVKVGATQSLHRRACSLDRLGVSDLLLFRSLCSSLAPPTQDLMSWRIAITPVSKPPWSSGRRRILSLYAIITTRGGLGIYNIVPPDVADLIVLGGPVHVGGQLLALTHASLAAEEPYVLTLERTTR